MAGFRTQADLNRILTSRYGWSPSRLGNYESGQSVPKPDDLSILAKETDTSECWLMFGIGPIRSQKRLTQAIRHQNLTHIVDQYRRNRKALSEFLAASELSRSKLNTYLNDPFKRIPDRLARRMEQALNKPEGWMDEQHVDSDPLCNQFPDDFRELMTIYSEMPLRDRARLLQIARILGSDTKA